MPRTKRPLADADANAAEPAPKKKNNAKGRKGAEKDQDNAVTASSSNDAPPSNAQSSDVSSSEAPWTWITTARLNCDRRREAFYKKDDNDEEPSEEEKKAAKAEWEKYNRKPLSEHPDWPWRVSKPAYHAAGTRAQDVDKRNPDIFGMYIYNDYWGYGTVEVIENMLLAWATEYQKKDCSVWELWKHIETIAHFFALVPDLIGFHKRVNEILNVIGLAVLSTLNKLEAAGLLKPDSPVKDLELVLCLLLDFISDSDANFDDIVWPYQVVAYANKVGLKLDKMYNMEATVEKYSEDKLEKKKKDLVYSAPKEDKFGWKGKWKAFLSRWGIKRGGRKTVGGDHFDITKMSKADRIRYSFDKTDPMEQVVIEEDTDEEEG